jgi:hypothetical protein
MVLKVEDTAKSDAAWRPARSKVAVGVLRSKMTNKNWVGGLNAQLD